MFNLSIYPLLITVHKCTAFTPFWCRQTHGNLPAGCALWAHQRICEEEEKCHLRYFNSILGETLLPCNIWGQRPQPFFMWMHVSIFLKTTSSIRISHILKTIHVLHVLAVHLSERLRDHPFLSQPQESMYAFFDTPFNTDKWKSNTKARYCIVICYHHCRTSTTSTIAHRYDNRFRHTQVYV